PLDAALDARGDLGRVRRARPAEKAQDLWCAEVLKGVRDQPRIHRLQPRAVTKQDIGRVFAFVETPVVRPQLMPAEQRIHTRGKHAEHARPRPRLELAEESVREAEILEVEDTVVDLREAAAAPTQLLRQPLPPIDANLDREGQPRLQADMHQAEIMVPVVEI